MAHGLETVQFVTDIINLATIPYLDCELLMSLYIEWFLLFYGFYADIKMFFLSRNTIFYLRTSCEGLQTNE